MMGRENGSGGTKCGGEERGGWEMESRLQDEIHIQMERAEGKKRGGMGRMTASGEQGLDGRAGQKDAVRWHARVVD